MLLAIAMTVGFLFLVWLVFFKMKWIKFSIMWGILCSFFFLHVLLIFLIGLRFVTPYSTDAKVIQHTIQLIPRLPEPTLVTAVLVEPNVPVKRGQPLFQFDRRPYEYKVNAVKAQLTAAEQKVLELKAQLDAATAAVAQAKAQRGVLKEGLAAAISSVVEARVTSIWQGSGEGQLLPSGDLPKFNPAPPTAPQGLFAVQIVLDAEDQSQFPIGTQGAAAIYTSQGAWAALRRIAIRGRTWMNWLYPLPI
jgi:hypothetical protein